MLVAVGVGVGDDCERRSEWRRGSGKGGGGAGERREERGGVLGVWVDGLTSGVSGLGERCADVRGRVCDDSILRLQS